MFKGKKDWKDNLNDDAHVILSDIIDSTKKHRCAYSSSDDVKTAQLWTALVEMKKQLDETTCLLKKVEMPFRAIIEIGEEEKKKTIEKIVNEIIEPADEATQEASRKLVESLMKF